MKHSPACSSLRESERFLKTSTRRREAKADLRTAVSPEGEAAKMQMHLLDFVV